MKTITTKTCNGRWPYRKFGGSASEVQQVLDQIHDEMVALGGNYKWSLDGHTRYSKKCPATYRIIATYAGGHFVESTGRTPAETLRGCTTAWTVLQRNYEGDWK